MTLPGVIWFAVFCCASSDYQYTFLMISSCGSGLVVHSSATMGHLLANSDSVTGDAWLEVICRHTIVCTTVYWSHTTVLNM